GSETRWISCQKIREGQTRFHLAAELKIRSGVDIRICREVQVTPDDTRSPLMSTPNHVQVVGYIHFDRVVIAGLHVDAADREAIRIDWSGATDHARTDVESHMPFEGNPDVLHADFAVVDNLRMDAVIYRA